MGSIKMNKLRDSGIGKLVMMDSMTGATIEPSCLSHTRTPLDASARPSVVVAMSGGVDSSTTAALLKEQGYRVIGITLNFCNTPETQHMSTQHITDAIHVAQKLQIPHYTLECSAAFFTAVVLQFAHSYACGETPLPCAICNKHIKFDILLEVAQSIGASQVATGHYARIIKDGKHFQLHKGADKLKDQSYFLFLLTQKQLSNILFPLGEMTKHETRAIARKYDLPVQNKKDSQDICFLKDRNYRGLVQRLQPDAFVQGKILRSNGAMIGTHNGIGNYTIGQRRGLHISHTEPLYVLRLERENNTVVVGTKEELLGHQLLIKDINWLDGLVPNVTDSDNTGQFTCGVKLRYVQNTVDAVVSPTYRNRTATISMLHGYFAITPGQACVMYEGTRLLGGGWIAKAQTPTI